MTLRTITTPIRAKVPQPYRELLYRYRALINAERKKRGLRLATAAEVAGAMICFILDHHQKSILDGYEKQRTGAFLKEFDSLLEGVGGAPAVATLSSEDSDV